MRFARDNSYIAKKQMFFGGVFVLFFISLVKVKGKPTKENISETTKMFENLKKGNVKVLGLYWTLGRYDGVMIFEAPNEKAAMKLSIDFADQATFETMVAVPREEAIKLV
jgi:uncharacterized protein with GYD domain